MSECVSARASTIYMEHTKQRRRSNESRCLYAISVCLLLVSAETNSQPMCVSVCVGARATVDVDIDGYERFEHKL